MDDRKGILMEFYEASLVGAHVISPFLHLPFTKDERLGFNRQRGINLTEKNRSTGKVCRKLTPEQVRLVRASGPREGSKIAKALGISRSAVSLIKSRKTYGDID